MDHKVVLLYRNESASQSGVHEGEYSPYVLAHMIEIAVYDIQKILDPPRGALHWSMIHDRYRCRVGNLRYLGFEAPYPNAHVGKAHNVELGAIAIPACFCTPSQSWIEYYSDTARRIHQDQGVRKGWMAGPRYHQYLQLEGDVGELAGAMDLATNGITVEHKDDFNKISHRLHLKQQDPFESLRETDVPQVAIWQGHHWQTNEHDNKVSLTIVNFRFRMPRPAPQFQPVTRLSAIVETETGASS